MLLAGVVSTSPAVANGDRLYLDCPCTIESDGTTLHITAGVRSFRSSDSGALFLRAEGPVPASSRRFSLHDAEVSVTDVLASGATLDSNTYDVAIQVPPDHAGEREIDLVLYEQDGESQTVRDRVRMENPVDLSGAFQVADLDYLKDADGDGVGDVNERLEGTDPADAESTPGPSTLDVLALHSPEFAEFHDGDATTRIQHVVTLANNIYRDSSVGIQLRVVGTVQVQVDEAERLIRLDDEVRQVEPDRHGADLIVVFRGPAPNLGYCGIAPTNARHTRGRFDSERDGRRFATVVGACGGRTLAHELGHLMGLGHSFWQGSAGTWRWSRGHAVDYDFGTVMSYGPQNGNGVRIEVFSDPSGRCIGLLEVDKPCGVDGEEVNGADAVASLEAVRFQIAAYRESHPDSDEDGFVDPVDALPTDSTEWRDADGDGLGDNADTDDDNDGVSDDEDAFPFDASETADMDDDGVGDNADAFPQDPGEILDADGDGVGDNADAFPDDPLESADSDGDGVGDNADPWPDNPAESTDTDGDGVGDNADGDDDGDGAADDLDAFPLDAARSDLASYVFTGEATGDQVGEILSRAGDGDAASFLIGVPQHDVSGRSDVGAIYLVSASDLVTQDAADGRLDRVIGLENVVSGANSWKLVGETGRDRAGHSLVSTGDMDGDGHTDVLIGAPHHGSQSGAAYFVSGADLAAADTADGFRDHTVRLFHVAPQPGSWKFVGENDYDQAGIGVAPVPDTDGDGKAELLIGAWAHNPGQRPTAGVSYLVTSSDFGSADEADGMLDGLIDLGHAADQAASWKFVGESSGDRAGSPVAAPGDVDGDGSAEISIHARFAREVEDGSSGAVYLISLSDLAAADEADGQSDHVVNLGRVADQPKSWKLHNGYTGGWSRWPMAIANDEAGSISWLVTGKDVFPSADLLSTDTADGSTDGVVDLDRLVGQSNSWKLRTEPAVPVGDPDGDGGDNLLAWGTSYGLRMAFLFSPEMLAGADAVHVLNGFVSADELNLSGAAQRILGAWPLAQVGASTAGDVDGDGISDLLLGNPGESVDNRPGAVYLLLGADLAAIDRVDTRIDERLFLGNVAGDTDNDGVSNTFDRDDDGDGTPDVLDPFQLDPNEWADSDNDRLGDNADAFPFDPREKIDTDGDGLGDRFADDDDDGDGIADSEDAWPLDSDNDGFRNTIDPDDDGDGVPDIEDALPIDPTESEDADGDGTGNNADTDDDNDGVSDGEDTFPFDPQESVDTDADGVGDNADAFPTDPNEAHDHDGDGVGDNGDTDDDNDGVLDGDDNFPLDAGASNDADGDGVADSRDAFPNDAGESEDTDADGIGDNTDSDDDNDGVGDPSDVFPRDASRSDLTSVRLDLGLTGDDSAAFGIAAAGDLDGGGTEAMLISAPDTTGARVVYVVAAGDLSSADGMDGVLDGSAQLHRVLAGTNSWKLTGEDGYVTGTVLAPLGDLTGDGTGEFLVGASAQTSAGYVISGADLLAADSADGVADGVIDLAHIASQPASWKLRGYWRGGPVQASFPADMDGDGSVELAIGQADIRDGDSPGTVQVISANALPMLDALHGGVDGTLSLSSSEGHELWRLIGEMPRDRAGTSILTTDFNGDGHADLVVGAPENDTVRQDQGAIYLLAGADLASADLSDGSSDRQIDLARVQDQPNSWKLVVDVAESNFGYEFVAGDLDGDQRQDLIVTSRDSAGQPLFNILTGLPGPLAGIDRTDGATDGVVSLTGNRSTHHRQLTWSATDSASVAGVTDFDGDGQDDILVEIDDPRNTIVANFISASALFGNGDDSRDIVADVDDLSGSGGSYQVHAPEVYLLNAHVEIAAAGDVDADGLGDILLAVFPFSEDGLPAPASVVYLIVAADLPHLDMADGRMDGRIFLSNLGRGLKESLAGGADETDSSVTETAADCVAGLLLQPGESCAYPDTDDEFTVNVRGRGRFLDRLAGIRVRINNESIDGRVYDFEASHQGDGVWRIDRVAGSTEPPSADDTDGDGIPDVSDPDDDNDGTPDLDDPCPLDSTNTCDDASSVASLEVSGMTPLTSIGETIQLAATAHMLNGSSQAIASESVHWVSADSAVATVIDGTVTATGGGNARIVATYQGHKAVVEVSVHISVRETGTVRVIYAVPSDRAFRSDYRDAVGHAVVDLQSWYRRQTGGLTFSIHDTTPEQCQMSESSDHFDQDPWNKVVEGLQHCAPVQANTSTFVWVVYPDLDQICDQRGILGRAGPGLTILHSNGLEGLIGNRMVHFSPCGRGPHISPLGRYTGGLGHELAHAFGLRHPPGCEEGLATCDYDSLMHLGYVNYPYTYLRPDDKELLLRSPFVGRDPAHRPLTDDAGKAVAIRGTVKDPDGNVVEGIRVSAHADAFWGWGQSEPDGTFEIRLPERATGSTLLSAHAGGVADCGWLGYHGTGGLTTLRERASAVAVTVGEGDPVDIEIGLPVVPGELCQGQRTVSGTVLGPEGEPVEVTVRAFDRWSRTGDDGQFEIPLPEDSDGTGRSSPLYIHAPECGHFGFYGPNGFTTRPAEAAQIGVGGVDTTDIQVRLPATPGELCNRQPRITGTVLGTNGEPVAGIELGAESPWRWVTSGADGTFRIRLLEGTTGSSILLIRASCGTVGFYGPGGFTTRRDDATLIELGEGNVTGIEIRLPQESSELCAE